VKGKNRQGPEFAVKNLFDALIANGPAKPVATIGPTLAKSVPISQNRR
jgi:hypothetical protein